MCSACSGNYEDPEMTQCDREATEEEAIEALAIEALEQEQILEASRSVRRGDFMLFAALRQNGVIR